LRIYVRVQPLRRPTTSVDPTRRPCTCVPLGPRERGCHWTTLGAARRQPQVARLGRVSCLLHSSWLSPCFRRSPCSRLSPCSLLPTRSLLIPLAYLPSPFSLRSAHRSRVHELGEQEGGRELGCEAANRGAGQTAANFAHAYDVGAMAAARRLSAFLRNTAHRRSATGHLRPSWRGQHQWPQEAAHNHRGLRGTGLPACAESGERAGCGQARMVSGSQGGKVTSQVSSPPGVGSRCGGA
jgi:hypothetical protein